MVLRLSQINTEKQKRGQTVQTPDFIKFENLSLAVRKGKVIAFTHPNSEL
jgi:hypothetical protein